MSGVAWVIILAGLGAWAIAKVHELNVAEAQAQAAAWERCRIACGLASRRAIWAAEADIQPDLASGAQQSGAIADNKP